MEKNKKIDRYFGVKLWQELADKNAERMTKKLKVSPIGYPLLQIGLMGFFLGLFVLMSWLLITLIKPIPFEVEGSCNTGFIGVDYKSTIDNQPYFTLDQIHDGSNPKDFRLVKHTKYFREYLPKELNLKNIDGLNCNFKIKGAIPLFAINQVNW